MGDLSTNFSRKEFACKCGCGFDDVDKKFVELLQAVRDEVGFPIKINSGCRCEKHNRQVSKSTKSAHIRGKAVDIKVPGSRERFKLLKALFDQGFRRIGIEGRFIHCDVDDSLDKDVFWMY